nr:DUF1931 domain-containing protein [Haloferax sp. KTX1]
MYNLIVKPGCEGRTLGPQCLADFYDALDEEVAELLDDAAWRAEANDRKTVQPRNL